MTGTCKLIFALCFFCGTQSLAQAHEKHGEARGELLYATHCIACHTLQVHWREQRLVKDWNSLKTQVRRWQANTGLGWSEEEITDVTRYLNATHYGFLDIEQNDLTQGNKPKQILRKY